MRLYKGLWWLAGRDALGDCGAETRGTSPDLTEEGTLRDAPA